MVTPQSMTSSSYDFKWSQREFHVWCASLFQPAHVVEHLYGLLSGDEKSRAKRYYFAHLQQYFVVASGVRRSLLARYTDLQPEQLAFTYLQAGKPELSEKQDPKVFFNLSHSNDLVLYAFSGIRNVGIDIEYIRPVDDLELIAERNFSAYETVELKKISPDQVLDGFFNCWTRKAAYIKAMGNGITFPLQDFDMSLGPGELAKLLSHGSMQEAARWSMVELHPADGYVAALAVEVSAPLVTNREWNHDERTHSAQEPQ